MMGRVGTATDKDPSRVTANEPSRTSHAAGHQPRRGQPPDLYCDGHLSLRTSSAPPRPGPSVRRSGAVVARYTERSSILARARQINTRTARCEERVACAGRVRVRISNRCSRRARSVVASGSSFQFTPGGRSAPARSLTGRWAAGGCSSARRRSLPRAARWVPQSRPRVADARGRDERIRWVAPGRRPGHRSNKIRLVMMCPLLGTQVLWEGTVH
jgi:hypothetical protein